MAPVADDLDGYSHSHVYEDGTLVRLSIRHGRRRVSVGMAVHAPLRTTHARAGDARGRHTPSIRQRPQDTKGHERHVAPDPEPQLIEFPGMEALYERFWDDIPKQRFGPSDTEGESL